MQLKPIVIVSEKTWSAVEIQSAYARQNTRVWLTSNVLKATTVGAVKRAFFQCKY